ncbi:MAG: ATP-binding protein [Magnetococcales bacterium]|nr:ATP-binding protein [Magnetococcales bacterium]
MNQPTHPTIRPRDREAVLQSLRAGVVPRHGLHLIQVGRADEVKALMYDITRIGDGGSAIRFIIGAYGSGKTFFINMIRALALEKGLVAAHVDLNPDRRLHGTGGQARSLYAELMRNLATRSKRDGGAMSSVVERFVGAASQTARENGKRVGNVIHDYLGHLSEMTGGYDFAEVLGAYWKGYEGGNDILRTDAVRWLRGEFSTRTEARKSLGVRTIVDDDNYYDHLKLMSRFLRLAGYGGLLLCLDEMVNLYKLGNTKARTNNYEQILRILNDVLQGSAEGLGVLFGGTPEFLTDQRRGLFSYEALESRLTENRFAAVAGIKDMSGPVIRLANLTPEDLFVLLTKLRYVHAGGNPEKFLIHDDGIKAFMNHCSKRIGSAYFQTPRNSIRAFLDLLAILEQQQEPDWQGLLQHVIIQNEDNPDLAPLENTDGENNVCSTLSVRSEDDDFHEFKL